MFPSHFWAVVKVALTGGIKVFSSLGCGYHEKEKREVWNQIRPILLKVANAPLNEQLKFKEREQKIIIRLASIVDRPISAAEPGQDDYILFDPPLCMNDSDRRKRVVHQLRERKALDEYEFISLAYFLAGLKLVEFYSVPEGTLMTNVFEVARDFGHFQKQLKDLLKEIDAITDQIDLYRIANPRDVPEELRTTFLELCEKFKTRDGGYAFVPIKGSGNEHQCGRLVLSELTHVEGFEL